MNRVREIVEDGLEKEIESAKGRSLMADSRRLAVARQCRQKGRLTCNGWVGGWCSLLKERMAGAK